MEKRDTYRTEIDGFKYEFEYRLPKYKEPFFIKDNIIVNFATKPKDKVHCIIASDDPKLVKHVPVLSDGVEPITEEKLKQDDPLIKKNDENLNIPVEGEGVNLNCGCGVKNSYCKIHDSEEIKDMLETDEILKSVLKEQISKVSPPSANDGREGRTNMKAFEIFCENYSQIIMSWNMVGAIDEFEDIHPLENIIRVDNVSFKEANKDIWFPTDRSKAEQWISVEDRLPELEDVFSHVNVLVFDGKDCIPSTYAPRWNRHRFLHFCNLNSAIRNVTHWQPLPSAPLNNDKTI